VGYSVDATRLNEVAQDVSDRQLLAKPLASCTSALSSEPSEAVAVPAFNGSNPYANVDGVDAKCCCNEVTHVCRLSEPTSWTKGCGQLVGSGYHSYMRPPYAQSCAVQPREPCSAVSLFKSNIEHCVADSPWANVRTLSSSPAQQARYLMRQARDTIEDPIGSVRQQTESFCGPASVVVLLAVAFPTVYLDMVHHLYCTGKWFSPFSNYEINANLALASQWRKVFGNEQRQMQNILETPLEERSIRAIDWMAMGAVRNAYDIKVLGMMELKIGSVVRGGVWQGTSPDMMSAWLNGILGGGELIVNTAPGLQDVFRKGRHVPSTEEWAKVITTAQEPLKVLVLHMQVGGDRKIEEWNQKNHAGPWNWFMGGSANHLLALISAKDDKCITWTWGKFVTFDCDSLRLRTEQAFVVDLGRPRCRTCPQVDVERVAGLKAQADKASTRGGGSDAMGLEFARGLKWW